MTRKPFERPQWEVLPRPIPDLIRKLKHKGRPLLYISAVAVLGLTQTIETTYSLDTSDNLVVRRSVVATNGKRHDRVFLAAPIFLATPGANSWPVPSDWNNAANTIECIAGGGSGAAGRSNLSPNVHCGGGGAYSLASNIALTPGGSASYTVGPGGTAVAVSTNTSTVGNAGSDTWFKSTGDVLAKAGSGGGIGTGTVTAAPGGQASSGVGSTKSNGGDGGGITGSTRGQASGGGGAGGPNGAGNNGVASTVVGSTAGGSGDAGSGGSAGTSSGGAGGNGTEYDASHGSGGGGGGNQPSATASAGNGGLYGGGGGGIANFAGTGTITSGAGVQGLIIINYTPLTARPMSQGYIFG